MRGRLYENLLDRPPDKRPMEGLAEWQMRDGAWIQVYEDKQRAGFSSVTFAVEGFRAAARSRRTKGSGAGNNELRLREDRDGQRPLREIGPGGLPNWLHPALSWR